MKQNIKKLTGLGSDHVSQDPEGLGLHVDAAAAPVSEVQVLLCTLDGLIDRGGAVYKTLFNWESTATTDRGRQTPRNQTRSTTRHRSESFRDF